MSHGLTEGYIADPHMIITEAYFLLGAGVLVLGVLILQLMPLFRSLI